MQQTPHVPQSLRRGRLLSAAQIRMEIFQGTVSEWWVRRRVAPQRKLRLGRSTVRWFEQDVLEWLAGREAA